MKRTRERRFLTVADSLLSFFYKKPRDPFGSQSFLKIDQFEVSKFLKSFFNFGSYLVIFIPNIKKIFVFFCFLKEKFLRFPKIQLSSFLKFLPPEISFLINWFLIRKRVYCIFAIHYCILAIHHCILAIHY